MSDLYQVMKDFGFPVALAIFFTVTNWLREKKMAEAMDDLRKFNQGTLTDLVKEGQRTSITCTEALKNANESTHRLIDLLESRPCVAEPSPNGRRI